MNALHVYSVTDTELQVIVSVCGLKKIYMFVSKEHPHRAEKIQAICKLLNDGMLVHRGGSIQISPPLERFGSVLKNATQITVIRPMKDEAPPFCVYYARALDEFVYIVPHGNKNGSYKLCLSDTESLFEELENMNLLPQTGESATGDLGEPCEEDAAIIEQLGNEQDWDDYLEQSNLAKNTTTAAFEHHLDDRGTSPEVAIVCRPVFAYCTAIRKKEQVRCFTYRKQIMIDWLKGAEI